MSALKFAKIKAELKRRRVSLVGLASKAEHSAALARARLLTANRSWTEDMVSVPGGAFVMGTRLPPPYPGDGEGPPRLVVVSDFFLDRAEVDGHIATTHTANAVIALSRGQLFC